MKNKKSLLVFSAFFVVILALGLCLLTLPGVTDSPRAYRAGARPAQGPSFAQEDPSISVLKDRELLGIEPSSGNRVPSAGPYAAGRYGRVAPGTTGTGTSPNGLISPEDYQIDLNKLKANRYAYGSRPYAGRSGEGESVSSRGGVSGGTGPASRYSGAASSGMTRRQAQDRYDQEDASAARNAMLSAQTPLMNREQQKKLERQLKGMSSGIERAIAKAMIPQGKKASNIEKYLARRSGGEGAAVSAGPFASVVQQVADQKSGVVNSISDSFGSAAGRQAGQIMDSFKNEMQSAVNAPGQTPQQIAAATKAINEKYQKRLEKFSQNKAAQKAVSDRVSEDEKLKQELTAKYGEKIGAQMGQKIDEARAKDLELSRQQLSTEEYYNRVIQNNMERDKALRKVLEENKASSAAYNKIMDDQAAERQKQEAAQIESGQKLEKRMTSGEKEFAVKNAQAQTQNIVSHMEKNFGPQAGQAVQNMAREYEEELKKNMQANPDGSEKSAHEIEQQNEEARRKFNERLQKFQQDENVKKATNDSLQQVLSSDQMKNVPEQAKKEWAAKATPILQDAYRQQAQVEASPDLSAQEKQRKLQEIQRQMQEKLGQLSGGGASADPGKMADEAVQKMMSTPDAKKMSPRAKRAVEEQARPILEQMYRDAAQIQASNMRPEEKQSRLKALEQQAQQQLGQIQVPQEQERAQ